MEENLYMKDCIRTYTGKYLNVFNPDPSQICIEDIAHALANTCRFAGHTQDYYSVAQHSVMCAHKVSDRSKIQALMHDAAEAYLTDIPSPIKKHLPDYRRLENMLLNTIGRALGFDDRLNDEVKAIDKKRLEYEWEHHVIHSNKQQAWSPEKAERIFLDIWRELKYRSNRLPKLNEISELWK
ncbi:MAG TPA: hypothetical protein VK152_00260 [Paludibacter sp.]|nr:hypothetical protein [Paludibacter sp.]